jgi:hypothetical protein
MVNNIDGFIGKQDIGNRFASKYSELYNSTGEFDKAEMSTYIKDVNNMIKQQCVTHSCYDDHSISVSGVIEAMCNLKAGKHDGDVGHYTDHLINGTTRLYTHLSLLFSCIIQHGYAPKGFSLSTIIPIPKNKRKSLNDFDNYRGIALSSVLGKLLDRILLKKASPCI